MKTEQAIQDSPSQTICVITFRLHRQVYALRVETIKKIIDMVKITPVPQLQGVIEGVINFHGTAIPVLHLAQYLSLPVQPPRLNTPILIMTIAERTIGLIVDEILDVIHLLAGELIPPGRFLPDGLSQVPSLLGLLHAPQGTILLLDLNCLFVPQQIRLVQSAIHSFSKSGRELELEISEIAETGP